MAHLHLATERNSKTRLSFSKSVNLEGLALRQHVLGLAKRPPQLAETATRKERARDVMHEQHLFPTHALAHIRSHVESRLTGIIVA